MILFSLLLIAAAIILITQEECNETPGEKTTMNPSIAREAADNSDSNGLQGLDEKCLKFLEAR